MTLISLVFSIKKDIEFFT